MAIDLTTKFLPLVDEKFTKESKRSLLTNNDFEFTGANAVKVYSVTTVGMNDYDRRGTKGNNSRYGEVKGLDATTEEYTLEKDRSFTFAVDRLDIDETLQALQAGEALERQLREVTIPEVDTYVYKKMCAKAGTVADSVAVTHENIADTILTATTVLDDNLVNEVGRVLVVTPITYQMMKKSKDIIMNTDVGQEMRLKGVIAMYDGMAVVKVPASRLPKDFCFMVAHPCATVAPVKLKDYTIHSNPPGISGDLVEGRINYGALVLENKKKAIYYKKQVKK